MTAIQTPTMSFGLGLTAPDGSMTYGWEYLPTMADQLRYLREHYDTKPYTVYRPTLILFIEEVFADGPANVAIQTFDLDWSSIDLEAVANGNVISKAMTQAPPRVDQLTRRPVHSFSGIPVGMCIGGCGNVLDGVLDDDHSVCKPCWNAL